MEDWIIAEDFTLPSQGKVYSEKVNANVKVRSMTTEEEMKRLGHSPYVYKMFSDMIDDCLVEKPGISAYDMCLGDYQFLLYKVRTVTYGPEYKIQSVCPHCGEINKLNVNLDNLQVNTYKEEFKASMEFQLPVSKKLVKLRWQTPRMLDDIEKKTKESNSKSADTIESAVLYNVMSLIDTVDGVVYDDTKKEVFVRKLPMRDTSAILNHAKKCLSVIGIDTNIENTCKSCKNKYTLALPITGEFFEPTED